MASPQGIDYRQQFAAAGLTEGQIVSGLAMIGKGVSFGDAVNILNMAAKPAAPVKAAVSVVSKAKAGNGDSSREDLLKRIADLEAQVTRKNTLSLKVSEKGAVSVYGLGRFPVTLYAEQWARLEMAMPSIAKFIAAHKAELTYKHAS